MVMYQNSNNRRFRPVAAVDPESLFLTRPPGWDQAAYTPTWERPIAALPAETVLGAAVSTDVPLPDGCCGVRFIAVTGSVVASFNGGGTRTILDGDTYSGLRLMQLQVNTGGASGVTVQTWGFGEPF